MKSFCKKKQRTKTKSNVTLNSLTKPISNRRLINNSFNNTQKATPRINQKFCCWSDETKKTKEGRKEGRKNVEKHVSLKCHIKYLPYLFVLPVIGRWPGVINFSAFKYWKLLGFVFENKLFVEKLDAPFRKSSVNTLSKAKIVQ